MCIYIYIFIYLFQYLYIVCIYIYYIKRCVYIYLYLFQYLYIVCIYNIYIYIHIILDHVRTWHEIMKNVSTAWGIPFWVSAPALNVSKSAIRNRWSALEEALSDTTLLWRARAWQRFSRAGALDRLRLTVGPQRHGVLHVAHAVDLLLSCELNRLEHIDPIRDSLKSKVNHLRHPGPGKVPLSQVVQQLLLGTSVRDPFLDVDGYDDTRVYIYIHV